MDVVDGSCVRRLVDISGTEYEKMSKSMLQVALYRMRTEMDQSGTLHGMWDGIYHMKKTDLIAEVLERLGQLPETCNQRMDVGKRFDPNAEAVTFTHVSDAIDAIREWPLPDLALDAIIENLKRISPGIVMKHVRRVVCGQNAMCESVRFARPVHMTASGVCTLKELERVPIGPDVLFSSQSRLNAFTPGEPTGTMQLIRYVPSNDLQCSGSWHDMPAKRVGGVWSMWRGEPVTIRVYR